MGDLTRAELRTEIDKNLGSKLQGLSGSDLTDAQDRIHRAIRQSELRIARGRSLKELNYSDSVTVTVSGTPSLDAFFSDFPQNWKDIYSLRWQDASDGRAHKLTYRTPRQWDRLYGVSYELTTGIPKFYTVSKDENGAWQLEFHPAPSTESTLFRRYSVWPAQMTQDTNTSTLEYVDDLIIAWTTEWLFQSSGEIEDAQRWRAVRRELLGGVILEEAESPDVSILPGMDSETKGPSISPWEDPFSGLDHRG